MKKYRFKQSWLPPSGKIWISDISFDEPLYRGNGSNDYHCSSCGHILLAGCSPEDFTINPDFGTSLLDLSIKCSRCRKWNTFQED